MAPQTTPVDADVVRLLPGRVTVTRLALRGKFRFKTRLPLGWGCKLTTGLKPNDQGGGVTSLAVAKPHPSSWAIT
jgi:hypothetical protein